MIVFILHDLFLQRMHRLCGKKNDNALIQKQFKL